MRMNLVLAVISISAAGLISSSMYSHFSLLSEVCGGSSNRGASAHIRGIVNSVAIPHRRKAEPARRDIVAIGGTTLAVATEHAEIHQADEDIESPIFGDEWGGTDCGEADADLIIGVLGSPSERSMIARQTIRETWMTLPTGGANIVYRFILAMNEDGVPPENIVKEAKDKGDIVFVPTLDQYKNLQKKVQLYFRWAVDTCIGSPLILKTDDDVFINPKIIGEKALLMPRQRLYWGKFMMGMPAKDNKKKRLHDNYQNMATFPYYASGAGYVLSYDVARAVAYPKLSPLFHEDEDRSVGFALFAFNVTQVEDRETFRPWGQCTNTTGLLHYQRVPELLKRRFRRAKAGVSICGVPFEKEVICAKAQNGKAATWACPDGQKIKEVVGATYGKVYSSGSAGSCSEGIEGLEPLEWCHAKTSKAVVEKACLGKNKCSVKSDDDLFGGDPCKGHKKHILAAVRCG